MCVQLCVFFSFFLQNIHTPSWCKHRQKRTGIHIAKAAEAVEAGQEQLNRPRVSVSALLMRAMRAARSVRLGIRPCLEASSPDEQYTVDDGAVAYSIQLCFGIFSFAAQ